MIIKKIFFFLFILSFACAGFAKSDSTTNNKNQPNENIAEPVHKIIIINNPNDEKKSNERAERAEKHDQDDLFAQQTAAQAAQKQATFATPTFYLSFLNASLLLIALLFNWRANKTSEASLENARQRDKYELRAYVYVESFKTCKAINLDGSIGCGLALTWKNYGSTPALKVSSHFQYFEWHNPEFPPWFPFPDMPAIWGLDHGQANHIAPDGIINVTTGGAIPSSHIEEISKGWRRLFVWGWVKYEDIFGQAHITKFCYRSSGAGFENEDKNSPVIQFTLYPRNNCSDDECKNEDSLRPEIPADLAEKLRIHSDFEWHSWADFQRPTTCERAPDGTPFDNVGRDYYGIKPYI